MNKQYNGIKNGHPVSVDDSKLLSDCTSEEQQLVLNWIKANIIPRKTPLYNATSYDIKHILNRDFSDIYLTNNQIKDAMLICGFEPVDENVFYWRFNISLQSPAFLYALPFEKIKKTYAQHYILLNFEEGKSQDEIFIEEAVRQGVSTEQTAKKFIKEFYSGSDNPYGLPYGTRFMHLYRYSRAKGEELPYLQNSDTLKRLVMPKVRKKTIDDIQLSQEDKQLILGWIKVNVKPTINPREYVNNFYIDKALTKDTGLKLTRTELECFMNLSGYGSKVVKMSLRYLASKKSPFLLNFLPDKLGLQASNIWHEYKRTHKSKTYTHGQVNNLIIDTAVKLQISTERTAKEYCNKFLSGAMGDEFPNAPYLNYHCTPCEVYYETLLHLYRYARAKDDSLLDLS